MSQGRVASGSWEGPETVLPEPRDGPALRLLGVPCKACADPRPQAGNKECVSPWGAKSGVIRYGSHRNPVRHPESEHTGARLSRCTVLAHVSRPPVAGQAGARTPASRAWDPPHTGPGASRQRLRCRKPPPLSPASGAGPALQHWARAGRHVRSVVGPQPPASQRPWSRLTRRPILRSRRPG